MERVEIDWKHVQNESRRGRLMAILKNIPREQWTDKFHGNTFLHYACTGNNVEAVVALILHGKINIDDYNNWQQTAAFLAAAIGQPRILEILCSAGTLHNAMVVASRLCQSYTDEIDTVKVLLANGFRTSDMRHCTLGHKAFEQGVLRCRNVIVTLLGLKKRRRLPSNGRSLILPKLDRFLVKEVLAVEIWTTRVEKKWHNEE